MAQAALCSGGRGGIGTGAAARNTIRSRTFTPLSEEQDHGQSLGEEEPAS